MTPFKACVIAFICATLCYYHTAAQNYGTLASSVFISNCNQNTYYATSGAGATVFNNTNLGVYTQGSGSLVLRGAQVTTFKDPLASNVCGIRLYYRTYLQTATPGAFSSIDLPPAEACNAGNWPSGGACNDGDQKWQRVINDGETLPYAPVDLTTNAPGNYVLEVYYEATGSQTAASGCSDLVTLNNGGNYYQAFFTIQKPDLLISTNPTTCNGFEGSIVFAALAPNTSYQVTYLDDATVRGPITLTTNAAGQATITGLNAGLYTSFSFTVNGCSTDILTGVILSNPIFVPSFTPVPAICEGNAAPVLAGTSNNGIPGSWSPTPVNNLASGLYTFTPAANTCALPVNLSVTVIQRVTPVFSFGTSLTICGSGTVPTLPNTSLNGITGSWSPAVVNPNVSGTYVFTPSGTGCVRGTSFTVTVNPNITPGFDVGNSSSSCTGDPVPVLPTTSNNGITGTWSPATVSAATTGTYTFTPAAGQCALPFTYTHTVFDRTPPVFAFGNAITICSGDAVPALPTVSSNGISGTWSPAVISNTASGVYVFTPTSPNPCTPAYMYVVTVNPIVTPSFPFGTSASVCTGSTPPVLPNLSSNGIAGTWSPAVVDDQNTGTYTFTPDAGQCATTATFNYEVNPVPDITSGSIKDTSVYDGDLLPPYAFSTNNTNTGIRWTNSNTDIGLPAQGTGTVPGFTAVNTTDDPIAGVIMATPYINGCNGPVQAYRVIVLPLNKEVFVPNVFSPNNDNKNDYLYVYGNYVAAMEMHIFNQWGQHIITLNNKSQGWDGKFKGKPQPVGVYVYVLKAVLTDGRKINKKGSITLLR